MHHLSAKSPYNTSALEIFECNEENFLCVCYVVYGAKARFEENVIASMRFVTTQREEKEMYQYILFDLDGTLTDPKIGITSCVQYALRAYGIEEPDLDKLEPFIGPPLRGSFMEFYGFSEEQAEEAIAKYRERFSTVGLFENEIYDGIKEMLERLKKEGKKLAVASSKPTVFVTQILKHFSIDTFFDVVVGSELDGTRDKKEEVVEEALRQLLGGEEAKYRETVMVGDRKFDVQGAKAFSLDSIGVTFGYGGRKELEEEGATYIVDSVSELENVLLTK